MKTTYTDTEIANDYRLWQEYADPTGFDSEDAFNAKTEQEKVAFLVSCFGDDQAAQ